MADAIQKIKEQLNDFWQGLDKNKKIKLGISGLLIIISITGFMFLMTRKDYATLYTNLSLKDVGLITKQLDEMGIYWKTKDGDETTILVPEEDKNRAKIQLATIGLPKDGYSVLDAFNDTSWTMTDFEKKQRLAYALQMELSQTISEISGINNATVYIDIPEETSFIKDNGQATASVFLNTNGNRLSNDKVLAVKNLVAGSFKELTVDDVVIIDDSGRAYDDTNNSEDDFNLTDRLVIKQNVENKFNTSLKRFLENFYGYGNVDVRTSVQINFDSEVTNIVQFSPPIDGSDEGLIRSMEQVEEHSLGGLSGGISGVESNSDNITDYAEERSDKYSNISKIINYELNEINKQIKKMPGGIDSISAAIIINEDAIADGELTEDKKKEIEELVYAVTGLQTEKVKVSSGKFNKNIVANINDELNNNSSTNNNKLYMTIGILGFALLGSLGYMLISKRSNKNIEVNQNEKIIEDEIEEIDFEKDKSGYKKQIENFVDKKPEVVSQLLRTWLNEE